MATLRKDSEVVFAEASDAVNVAREGIVHAAALCEVAEKEAEGRGAPTVARRWALQRKRLLLGLKIVDMEML